MRAERHPEKDLTSNSQKSSAASAKKAGQKELSQVTGFFQSRLVVLHFSWLTRCRTDPPSIAAGPPFAWHSNSCSQEKLSRSRKLDSRWHPSIRFLRGLPFYFRTITARANRSAISVALTFGLAHAKRSEYQWLPPRPSGNHSSKTMPL